VTPVLLASKPPSTTIKSYLNQFTHFYVFSVDMMIPVLYGAKRCDGNSRLNRPQRFQVCANLTRIK
jgi:hypothetical protein